MMQRTNIEYLTHTWNPLAMRCTPISEGCKHCWHIQMANRLAKNPSISSGQRNAYAGGLPMLLPERLNDPLKRKKPARIGVQFMGDLFHEDVYFQTVASILGVISFCQDQTFMVLTKRPDRMARFFNEIHDGDYNRNFNWWLNEACLSLPEKATKGIRLRPRPNKFPLPNLYLGVSISSNKDLWMLPVLLQIPAAKRFVSLEPMLGPVDLTPYLPVETIGGVEMENWLAWVIIGGLSLPGGKVIPPVPEWIDDIVEQCDAAGVPLFIKDNAKYYRHREEFPG